MPRTRVKICGICRPQDAVAAARAGADAIGLVFAASSRRCLTVEQAIEIARATPPLVNLVGLFVDATAEAIREIIGRVPLAAVQLHGKEAPELVAELQPLRVIKALGPDAGELRRWKSAITKLQLMNMVGILLDSEAGQGGSGKANDWELIRALQEQGDLGFLRWIAAGGLTAESALEVVRMLRPYAVDVSSGVESKVREKSPEKIEAFIQAVRQADSE